MTQSIQTGLCPFYEETLIYL